MKERTVIIGGGFAGRQAVRALGSHSGRILLVDPSPVTTMLPALPDLAGDWVPEHMARRSLRELLPPHVELRQSAVTSIDLNASTLIAGDECIGYEHLLIAAGSITRPPPPEISSDNLHGLATLNDALHIRSGFAAYMERVSQPHVLVAGTGYTGLELAMSLAFRARAAGKPCAVTLVDPTPILLPSLPERQRTFVLDFLRSQGVDVRLGSSVESFDGQTAVVGGESLSNVFFCWAAGSVSAIPEIHGELERLKDGRIRVRPDLSLPAVPHVFAAGDSAAIFRGDRPLRKAVNFAYYGGRRAGGNIARRLRGRPTRPFLPTDLGWVVPFRITSIGRIAPGLWIRGRIGIRLHHLMCGLRNYSLKNLIACLKLALRPGSFTKGKQP